MSLISCRFTEDFGPEVAVIVGGMRDFALFQGHLSWNEYGRRPGMQLTIGGWSLASLSVFAGKFGLDLEVCGALVE